MGECRFDKPGMGIVCDVHECNAALCTHAAQELKRRMEEAEKACSSYVADPTFAAVGHYKERIRDLEARLTQREQLTASIMNAVRRLQPTGSPPPGDEARVAEWIVCHAQARLAQAEADVEKYRRYPFEPICLICGRLTPCMTEADLKPNDPGVPCTFDPTPKQLFEENAVILKRLRQAQAAAAAMREALREAIEYNDIGHDRCPPDECSHRSTFDRWKSALSPDAGHETSDVA